MPTSKPVKKEIKLSDAEADAYIDKIYKGEITEKDLPQNVYQAIANRLMKGVEEGYGMSIDDAYEKDLDLLNKLRENVYMFSAAKTYQQTKEISSLLIDENGDLRNYKEFATEAKKTYELWNDTYGQTEYSTAIGQAYAAQKWSYIETQKQVLPNLRYSAVSDPCDICAPLNGLIAPVGSPIWDTCAPLNHFNCKCLLLQEDEDAVVNEENYKDPIADSLSLMQPLFRSNPGKDGMIFNESHPYFNDIPKKDKELAQENFNLPLPPPVENEYRLKTYSEAKSTMTKYKVPKERKEAIEDYTGKWYSTVNSNLRFNEKIGESSIERVKKTINGLSDFLDNAPKVNFKTYRGLKFTAEKEFEDFVTEYKEGAIITDKGFMSTSVSPGTASDFTVGSHYQAFFEVHGKNGVLIEQYSDVPTEKEVLFNKGSKFKILNVEKLEPDNDDVKAFYKLTIEEL